MTNDGVIIAGQNAIRVQNFNLVTNAGQITAGLDGIEVRADNQVVNSAAGSITAAWIGIAGDIATTGPSGDDGIRAAGDCTSLTNNGAITAR